ncbi:MAG: SDR family oxidoreductase [Caldilineaceae bacterium]|nr:SDR family oxidoreductase [Caldilineaceae bacterium]
MSHFTARMDPHTPRPVALITGASRRIGIGAAVAIALAKAGWDIAITFWQPYDQTMPWGSNPADVTWLLEQLTTQGAQAIALPADLSQVETPTTVFDQVEQQLGPVAALIMAHCQSVDSNILNTTVESFDLHFALNARATWLLIREFGQRFTDTVDTQPAQGRIIALTSDHVVENLPYGASKGALDRIVLAATHEFRHLSITANVINPGATDTGWMTDELKQSIRASTPGGRIGLPSDCANLVAFLCSPEGGWINGQLLYSNGGVQ